MDRSLKAAKPRYHHGDLKVALIEAATRIVAQKRVEGFSVADAARAAGVSSGAPYRHFTDREDLLDHVAAAGYERLTEALVSANKDHPAGSVEGLVQCTLAYIDFAEGNPELLHLMTSVARPKGVVSAARIKGSEGHSIFMEHFKQVLSAQDLAHLDPHEASAPLWAMAHGFAMLRLSQSENFPKDRLTLDASIDTAVRAYLAGLRARTAPEQHILAV